MPFLDRHLARLAEACEALGRPQPEPGLSQRLHDAARASEMVVRLTLEAEERIESRPLPPAQPMRTVFSGTVHTRYQWKTTSRETFERARERVVPYRADEVILLSDGLIAEGCISSVFFWLGSTLCTPSLDLGILPGIGRARVLELAAARGVAVQEGHFTRAEIEGLPLFLVNSVRGIIETTRHGDWRTPKGDDRNRWLSESFWNAATVEAGRPRV